MVFLAVGGRSQARKLLLTLTQIFGTLTFLGWECCKTCQNKTSGKRPGPSSGPAIVLALKQVEIHHQYTVLPEILVVHQICAPENSPNRMACPHESFLQIEQLAAESVNLLVAEFSGPTALVKEAVYEKVTLCFTSNSENRLARCRVLQGSKSDCPALNFGVLSFCRSSGSNSTRLARGGWPP